MESLKDQSLSTADTSCKTGEFRLRYPAVPTETSLNKAAKRCPTLFKSRLQTLKLRCPYDFLLINTLTAPMIPEHNLPIPCTPMARGL